MRSFGRLHEPAEAAPDGGSQSRLRRERDAALAELAQARRKVTSLQAELTKTLRALMAAGPEHGQAAARAAATVVPAEAKTEIVERLAERERLERAAAAEAAASDAYAAAAAASVSPSEPSSRRRGFASCIVPCLLGVLLGVCLTLSASLLLPRSSWPPAWTMDGT